MRSHSRSTVGLIVATSFSLLASGCIGYPGDVVDDCLCPNLVSVAPTIDWVGTGELPDSVQATAGLDFNHSIGLKYLVPDGLEQGLVAIDRLMDAGYVPAEQRSPAFAVFTGDEWKVVVSGGQDAAEEAAGDVIIAVSVADDDRATEILQPFIDALGTVS